MVWEEVVCIRGGWVLILCSAVRLVNVIQGAFGDGQMVSTMGFTYHFLFKFLFFLIKELLRYA